MRRTALLALLLVGGCGLRLPAELATVDLGDEREVVALTSFLADHRTGVGALEQLLRHPSSNVREAAALALGRIEREAILPLADPDWEVRRAAAFAAGQIGARGAETALLARLDREAHPAVRVELWRALGRVGGLRVVTAATAAEGFERPSALVAAGLALARAKVAPGTVPALETAMADADPEVRAAALYAWHRAAGEVPAAVRRVAAEGLTSPSGSMRAVSVRLLSVGCGGVLAAVRLALTGSALSPHQRAALARGVARESGAEAEALLAEMAAAELSALGGDLLRPGLTPLLAALDGLQGRTLSESTRRFLVEAGVRADAAPPGPPPVVRRRARLLCALRAPLGDLGACDPETQARVLGRRPALAELRALLRHRRPAVRMAALEALAAATDATPELLAALTDPDLPVVATAAGLLKAPAAIAGGPALLAAAARAQRTADAEVTGDILRALTRLRVPGARSAFQAALRSGQLALQRLGAEGLRALGERAEVPVPPLVRLTRGALDPYVRALEPGVSRAIVTTDIGSFVLRLQPAIAPLTVARFVALGRRGFFDGLTFHRVVADFVVQGGDPRGDGWGGPGESLRCENNPTVYVTGTVGMALAGKDTGGSQWFVTLSPQPHLYGTYTAFARVELGMAVVERLVPGDRILRVVLGR